MIFSEKQHKALKAIRWDKIRSRGVQQQCHDDRLQVGWCGKRKRWVIARIVDAVVMSQFGDRTIPTSEKVPYVWKVWQDDNAQPLSVDDARLVPYIRRCDLWRMGVDKYMLQYDPQDWIDSTKERSEADDLRLKALDAFDRVKAFSDGQCGYVPKHGVSTKGFGPTAWR